MKSELMNLFLFIGIIFVVYLLFRNFKFDIQEGMETKKTTSQTTSQTTSSTNGIAGNAAAYGATIKSTSIQLQDALLISKYRSDYETTILNLDELINNLMLETALNVNVKNPQPSIEKLSQMNQAKAALNSVMKFVDGN
jgi:hypothetical protein